MTAVAAVYQGGVFRPAAPFPLADGTPVQLVVLPQPAAAPPTADPVLDRLRAIAAARGLPPPVVPDPQRAYELMRAIAEMPEEAVDDPAFTNRDHDEILYGGPDGAR